MRILADRFSQQAALVKTDVAGRRADQARYRVSLHVLRHVEADQFHTQVQGKLAGHFGFADTGRAGKQE